MGLFKDLAKEWWRRWTNNPKEDPDEVLWRNRRIVEVHHVHDKKDKKKKNK